MDRKKSVEEGIEAREGKRGGKGWGDPPPMEVLHDNNVEERLCHKE